MPSYAQAQENAIANLRRLRTLNDVPRGWRFAGLRFQLFRTYIENVSGVIKHYFTYSDREAGLIDRINYPVPLNTSVNTPTVQANQGFNNAGMGFEGTPNNLYHILHFDTVEEQDPERYIGIAQVMIFDGGSAANIPRPAGGFKSFNINGVTKTRLCMWTHQDMVGGMIPAWTTFIPNTRRYSFTWMGFLK